MKRPVILDYVQRGRLMPRPCRVCQESFQPKRKRQILCGRQACTNENHRRRGLAQWERSQGKKFFPRAPNKRYKKCECGAVVENRSGNTKYCESCRLKSIQASKAKSRDRLRGRGMVDPHASAVCSICGWRLQFSYDHIGRSMEQCQCGTRPVQLYGERTYDQREKLERELTGAVNRAEAPVDAEASKRSQGRTKILGAKVLRWGKGLEQNGRGDAFRQMTHKKGAA